MRAFVFHTKISQAEYELGQNLVLSERPAMHFYAFMWPRFAVPFAVLAALASALVTRPPVRLVAVLCVAGGILGSAASAVGIRINIRRRYRDAGHLRHDTEVTANMEGLSTFCDAGCKSFSPWKNYSKLLAKRDVVVLISAYPRFALLSLAQMPESQREPFLAYVRDRLAENPRS